MNAAKLTRAELLAFDRRDMRSVGSRLRLSYDELIAMRASHDATLVRFSTLETMIESERREFVHPSGVRLIGRIVDAVTREIAKECEGVHL